MNYRLFTLLVATLLMLAVAGCHDEDENSSNDTTAPTVLSTYPADDAITVGLNSNVIARFSEQLDSSTVTTGNFTLSGPGATVVTGTVSYDSTNDVAGFQPSAALAASTLFSATLTTSITDDSGNELAVEFEWTFTTGAADDTTAPTITSTIPADTATGVALNQRLTAVFDEQMESSSITTVSFTLTKGAATPVSGKVTCPGSSATFRPNSKLSASSTFTARVTTSATDLAGNALMTDYVWTFQTGTAAAAGPAPVVLGTAGNYVIVAKSGISTTGTTAVTGDLALSPSAASFLTGFSETLDGSNEFSTSAVVTGKLYAADYAPPTPTILTTAVLDMQTAYTDAAGRTSPDFTELGAGNIDGMTLAPGLYKWGTGVLIPIGVTLSGNANDIWIFQIAQDLTVNSGAIVTLSGGAQARNIFWQVAGQTVLGTTSDFKGIVLCQTAVVLQTGATMLGRALAQTAVTLDGNAVTGP